RGRVLERFVERQRAPRQSGRQRFAVQVLHDQELEIVLAADVVQRADVRMVEARDRARLALEALAAVRLPGGIGRQHLDRDDARDAGVESAIHLAHAATAKERDDLVRSQPGAGLQYHGERADYAPFRRKEKGRLRFPGRRPSDVLRSTFYVLRS